MSGANSMFSLITFVVMSGSMHAQRPLPSPGEPLPDSVLYCLGTPRLREFSAAQFQDGAFPFTPDGQAFVVIHGSRLSLRATATGKEIDSFVGGSVEAQSPDRSYLIVRSGRDLRLLATATGKEYWGSPGDRVIFSSDGQRLAMLAESSGEIVVDFVDCAAGRLIKPRVSLSKALRGFVDYRLLATASATVSPDLALAACFCRQSNVIAVVDLATGAVLNCLEVPKRWSTCSLHFLPDGRRIVARGDLIKGDLENGICIWNLVSGSKGRCFKPGAVDLLPDGRRLVLKRELELEFCDLLTGHPLAKAPYYLLLAYSPDGSLVATASELVEGRRKLTLLETTTGRMVRSLGYLPVASSSASFSPDGRTLVVQGSQDVVFVCDITGLATNPGQLPHVDLTAAEAEASWSDLVGADGPRSFAAFWRLAAGGREALRLLRVHLKPIDPPDFKLLARLLADLDSDHFAVRSKASETLAKMKTAQAALRAKLLDRPTLEVRRRLELILSQLEELPEDRELPQQLRMVHMLEQIGSPQARELLQTVAAGVPEAWLTMEARAALQRLKYLRGTGPP